MGLFKPHTLEKPHDGVIDAGNIHHLIYLMKARENQLHSVLDSRMKKAFVYTKAGRTVSGFGLKSFGNKLQEKGIFNSWMYEDQDTIQAFAKSYADRLVADAFLEAISENTGKGDEYKDHPIGPSPLTVNATADLEPTLRKLFHLHLLSRIEADMSWFLINGLLSDKSAAEVLNWNRQLCADLAPDALNLVDAFGLPDEALAAPIATNWVSYNEIDNQGELGPKEDFMAVLKQKK